MEEVKASTGESTKQGATLPSWAPWTIGGVSGLAVGLIAGVLLAGGLPLGTPAPQADPRLSDAFEDCRESVGLLLEDAGATLIIDVKGEEDATGASYSVYYCLESALGMPAHVSSHVGQTTSMDGRQTEEWDGIEFSWSYHPDRGIDGVFTYTGATE